MPDVFVDGEEPSSNRIVAPVDGEPAEPFVPGSTVVTAPKKPALWIVFVVVAVVLGVGILL